MAINHEIVKKLLKENRLVDLYKLSRFTYKVNDPIVEDSFYNKLEEIIKKGKLSDLVDQTYDDDDTPMELILEFNLERLLYSEGRIAEDSPYFKYLDSEKSSSIRAIDTYSSVLQYFSSIDNEDFILTPKGNGWNYKGLFIKNNNEDPYNLLELYLTRGRRSSGWNVTTNLSKVTPKKILGNSKEIIVYGEGIVDQSAVKKIPRRDGTAFTSARMAAGSMTRTGCVDEDCFKYLHYYVFNADNVSDTISGTLDSLKEQGFDVMPYIIIKPIDIPRNLEEFIPWMKTIMDEMYKKTVEMDLCADGLVLDVDNKLFEGSQSNQYNSRNCALKFEYWSQCHYKGIIKDILFEQQEVFTSVVIVIESLKTDDSCEARRISSYNVDYLKALDLGIGDEVYFERNSEAINVILTGDKLREAKGLSSTESNELKSSNSFGE